MAARAAEAERKGNVNDWLQIALLWSRFRILLGDVDAGRRRCSSSSLAAATDDVPCPYYELPVRVRLALLDVDADVHLARGRALVDGGELRGLRVLVEIAEARAAAVAGRDDDEVDRSLRVGGAQRSLVQPALGGGRGAGPLVERARRAPGAEPRRPTGPVRPAACSRRSGHRRTGSGSCLPAWR